MTFYVTQFGDCYDDQALWYLTYARSQRAEDILIVRNALGTQEYGEKAMALNYFCCSTQRP